MIADNADNEVANHEAIEVEVVGAPADEFFIESERESNIPEIL